MSKTAIIAGATFLHLKNFELIQPVYNETPYGKPSAALLHGLLQGKDVILLSRNGEGGSIAPHKINYRANIWALKEAGVTQIIALSPANGIRADMVPGVLVAPHQLIDYTHSRANTFFEDDYNSTRHVDFRLPYSETLRHNVLTVFHDANLSVIDSATYGVTQGPRLETLAETNRLERDGCDLVGMSGMPETILARELDMDYTAITLITNKAAGRQVGISDTLENIGSILKESIDNVHALFEKIVLTL